MFALGIDFGGGSSKATLIDEQGRVLATASCEYPTMYGEGGKAEQNPDDWTDSACKNIRSILAQGFDGKKIACICLDAATHTAVLADEKFRPVFPAVYWTDTRCVKEKAFLEERYGDEIFEKCKHRVDTIWSLPEILYRKNHSPEEYKKVKRVLFAKDYVRHSFTGDFCTDYIEAEGSMLFDFGKQCWDGHLLSFVGLKEENMPKIADPFDVVGTVSKEMADALGLSTETKVICGATDTVMEVFAAGGVNRGDMTLKLATAGRICCVDDKYYPDRNIVNYSHLKKGLYYPGSGTKSAAASLRWFRDTFGGDYQSFSRDAAQIPLGSGGLIFHPYLVGELTPYAEPALRGGFVGLSAAHTKAHFERAVMEGVVFSLLDCKNYLVEKGVSVGTKAYALGGGAKSDVWLQIAADALNLTLVVTEHNDSSFGSALCAAVASGFFSDLDEGSKRSRKIVKEVQPIAQNTDAYREIFKIYKKVGEFYLELAHESQKNHRTTQIL